MITEGAVFDSGFSVVDKDVRSGRDEFSVEEATVKSSFPTTIADGFKFFKTMSELEQTSRTFETAGFTSEVKAETVADNRDVEEDGNVHELVDLFFGQELGFVDEDASDMLIIFLDFFKEVIGGFNREVGRAFGTDTSEEFIAVFCIGFWFRDTDGMTAFFIVKGDLEELHGFSAAHRAIAKIEFCHEEIIPDLSWSFGLKNLPRGGRG